MKKLLFVLLAICMFAVPVMAQTADNPETVTWVGDLEDSFIEKEYTGDFYIFKDLGFQFVVPSGLEGVAITEEQADDGIWGIFENEDKSVSIVVSFRDLGCETLEDVEQHIVENVENAQIAGYYVINGLSAMMFVDPNDQSFTCVVPADNGYFIQITLWPITNETLNALSGYIFGSITPLD